MPRGPAQSEVLVAFSKHMLSRPALHCGPANGREPSDSSPGTSEGKPAPLKEKSDDVMNRSTLGTSYRNRAFCSVSNACARGVTQGALVCLQEQWTILKLGDATVLLSRMLEFGQANVLRQLVQSRGYVFSQQSLHNNSRRKQTNAAALPAGSLQVKP